MTEYHHDESEHEGIQPDTELSLPAKRALAIHELLVEKGIIAALTRCANVRRLTARAALPTARKSSLRHGADPEFKKRLLDDARAAVYELGYTLTHDAELAVVENTEDVHHLVVCTLCSCYPTSLLGPPPDWYKSFAYRQRAVTRTSFRHERIRPGTRRPGPGEGSGQRPPTLRYLVLPRRPAGTEGMSEDELAALVTRDCMIGVTDPLTPRVASTAWTRPTWLTYLLEAGAL